MEKVQAAFTLFIALGGLVYFGRLANKYDKLKRANNYRDFEKYRWKHTGYVFLTIAWVIGVFYFGGFTPQ